MKAVQAIAVAFCLLILATLATAQISLVQNFPEGDINWATYDITSTGTGAFNKDLLPSQFQLSAINAARADVSQKILAVIKDLKFSSQITVAEYLKENPPIGNLLEQYLNEYKIVGKPRLMPDSTVELTVQYPLLGDPLEALLPETGSMLNQAAYDSLDKENLSITGLVVDCRGIGLVYALCPRVLAEAGGEVYSIDWVIRDYAANNGVVQYASSTDDISARIGANPLKIIAEGPTVPGLCDVTISIGDAERLNALKEKPVIFGQCRVVFLIN